MAINLHDCIIKNGTFITTFSLDSLSNPDNIYLFKVNNRNTRKRCEICSRLTLKTPFSSVSIVGFEQVNVS